jgi:serine/threonine protein kinase
MGSPVYMCPQALLKGKISKKTDIYAFGVVLYELVFLSNPFDTSDINELIAMKSTENLAKIM